ncbi:MAG: hypothetical protein C5B54_07230 [Acidobacteria bacterium]|nr:MAG: hypothetical protein C5B54_07230 [Acidobacteriota bacterium]
MQVLRSLFSAFWILFFLSSSCFATDQAIDILKNRFSFSDKDITDLMSGKVISKVLDHKDKREIAVLGATVIDIPKESVIDSIRDIQTFKKGKEVLAVGKFTKFDADEIKTLVLDDSELDLIQNCKLRDCDIKLPSGWIQELAAEKDRSRKVEVLRKLLVDYSKEYLNQGNKVIVEYDNEDHPIRVQDEFQAVLEQSSSYLVALAPEFHDYLKNFPDNSPNDADGFVYWSKEKFGFKPVISLTHVSIYKQSDGADSRYFIASKQIFADHYYDASLGLTFLIDHPLAGNKMGCYLIYMNRSRIDALDGFLSSLRRAIATPRVRKGLETNLKLLRDRLEDKETK